MKLLSYDDYRICINIILFYAIYIYCKYFNKNVMPIKKYFAILL